MVTIPLFGFLLFEWRWSHVRNRKAKFWMVASKGNSFVIRERSTIFISRGLFVQYYRDFNLDRKLILIVVMVNNSNFRAELLLRGSVKLAQFWWRWWINSHHLPLCCKHSYMFQIISERGVKFVGGLIKWISTAWIQRGESSHEFLATGALSVKES